MAKFWLYHVPFVGVRVGQSGAYAPQPQGFASLIEAQSVPVPPGFTARIEGPDSSYVYVGGQWSPQFSRARVIEGVADPGVTRQHVEQRVSDWASRINALYKQVEPWLPAGWTAERRGTVQMHEELMRKFHVPSRDLPILNISHDGADAGRIEPRGLWIIGANGRLDFFGRTDQYVIVDTAENFAPPLWHIARLADRNNLQPFTKENFVKAL